MKTAERRFEVGQVVRHKTSGQKGIVTSIHEVCTKHSDAQHVVIDLAKKPPFTGRDELGPCRLEPTGTVSVNTGFYENDVKVKTYLLESINPYPQQKGE